MTSDVAGSEPRRGRGLFWGLIASLAINLIFIGGLTAALVKGQSHRHGGGESGLLGFAREFPGDRRKLVEQDFAAMKDSVRPLRRQVREAWDTANRLLTAEPFDAVKVKDALTASVDADNRLKLEIYSRLADTAAKLTHEERTKLQAWREKRKPKLFRDRGETPPGNDRGETPGKAPLNDAD